MIAPPEAAAADVGSDGEGSLDGPVRWSAGKARRNMSDELPDWLPDGWIMEIRRRKNGRSDKYYTSPVSGYTFRSGAAVMRYLNVEKVLGLPPWKGVYFEEKDDELAPPQKASFKDNSDGFGALQAACFEDSLNSCSPQQQTYFEDNTEGLLPQQAAFLDDNADRHLHQHSSFDYNIDGVGPLSTYSDSDKHSKDFQQLMSEDDSLEWLPEGWILEIRGRNNAEKVEDIYKCYLDPVTKSRFYSKEDVLHYLKFGEPVPASKWKMIINTDASDMLFSRIEYSPAELPPGWIKELKFRYNASGMRKDPYYSDPVSGYIFRTRKDVFHYVDTGEVSKHVLKPKTRKGISKLFRIKKPSAPITDYAVKRCLFECQSQSPIANMANETAELALEEPLELQSQIPVEKMSEGIVELIEQPISNHFEHSLPQCAEGASSIVSTMPDTSHLVKNYIPDAENIQIEVNQDCVPDVFPYRAQPEETVSKSLQSEPEIFESTDNRLSRPSYENLSKPADMAMSDQAYADAYSNKILIEVNRGCTADTFPQSSRPEILSKILHAKPTGVDKLSYENLSKLADMNTSDLENKRLTIVGLQSHPKIIGSANGNMLKPSSENLSVTAHMKTSNLENESSTISKQIEPLDISCINRLNLMLPKPAVTKFYKKLAIRRPSNRKLLDIETKVLPPESLSATPAKPVNIFPAETLPSNKDALPECSLTAAPKQFYISPDKPQQTPASEKPSQTEEKSPPEQVYSCELVHKLPSGLTDILLGEMGTIPPKMLAYGNEETKYSLQKYSSTTLLAQVDTFLSDLPPEVPSESAAKIPQQPVLRKPSSEQELSCDLKKTAIGLTDMHSDEVSKIPAKTLAQGHEEIRNSQMESLSIKSLKQVNAFPIDVQPKIPFKSAIERPRQLVQGKLPPEQEVLSYELADEVPPESKAMLLDEVRTTTGHEETNSLLESSSATPLKQVNAFLPDVQPKPLTDMGAENPFHPAQEKLPSDHEVSCQLEVEKQSGLEAMLTDEANCGKLPRAKCCHSVKAKNKKASHSSLRSSKRLAGTDAPITTRSRSRRRL